MSIEIESIQRIPIFATLAEDELRNIAAITVVRHYERGNMVLSEGDMNGGLHYIHSGLVKVFKTSIDGREQILRLITGGYTFNDVAALDGGPNPASVAAIEPSVIYCIKNADLHFLIKKSPDVADAVVQILAGRLRHLVQLAEDLSLRHVSGRVAKILLEQHDAGQNNQVAYRLTQQEIAALAGTAREVVGRALKRIEVAGAIKVNQGHITILNRERLVLIIAGMADP